MKKKTLSVFVLFIIFAIVINCIVPNKAYANPNDPRKGNLTVVKQSSINYTPIKGSEFTIYSVDDGEQDLNTTNLTPVQTLQTDENGIAKFENLELGRYLVKETNTPDISVSPAESFFIEIPTTTIEDGVAKEELDIKVIPKSVVGYGTVTITTEDGVAENENLPGVSFELEYKEPGTDEYIPVTTITKSDGTVINLEDELVTSNIFAMLEATNLPVGQYQVIMKDAPEGYIVDKTAQKFNIVATNEVNENDEAVRVVKVVDENGENVSNLAIKVNKPTLDLTSDNEDQKVSLNDKLNYLVTVGIPQDEMARLKTFIIEVNYGDSLIADREGFELDADLKEGTDYILTHYDKNLSETYQTKTEEENSGSSESESNNSESNSEENNQVVRLYNQTKYYAGTGEQQNSIKLEFTKAGIEKLENYSTLNLKIPATVHSVEDTLNKDKKSLHCSANLTYTTMVYGEDDNRDSTHVADETGTLKDDSQFVYTLSKALDGENCEVKLTTYGFKVLKIDSTIGSYGNPLQGAKFKISKSSEVDANGEPVYPIMAYDGKENTDVFTSDEKGNVTVVGLTDGTYYLFEISAPTYDTTNSEGVLETKSYVKLEKPVVINVNFESDQLGVAEDSIITIKNNKPAVLPKTGMVCTAGLIVLGGGMAIYGYILLKKEV